MSVSYGFYDSYNHDRLYDSVDISRLFDGIIHDGVYSTIGEGMLVWQTSESKYTNPFKISIGSGRAWFDHVWIDSDATSYLEINISALENNLSNKRVDAVCLYTDSGNRIAGFEIVRGTVSSSYINPILPNTATKKYHVLAYLKFKNDGRPCLDIIDVRVGTEDCPYVYGLLENFDTHVPYDSFISMFNNFLENKAAAVNLEVNDFKMDGKNRIDNAINNDKSKFNSWFNGLKDVLEGDPAILIESQILSMQNNFVEKSAVVQENIDNTTKIPSAKVVYDLAQTAGPAIISVTWTDASDAEIVDAVNMLDTGGTTLEELGWNVGDERTVHLNSLSAGDNNVEHLDQDVTLVIVDSRPYNGTGHFVVGFKKPIGYPFSSSSEWEKMNSERTNSTGWHNSRGRKCCDALFDMIPSTLQPIFKTFTAYTATIGGTNSSGVTGQGGKMALYACKEIYNDGGYIDTSDERNSSNIKILEYFETTANRSAMGAQQLRSPNKDNTTTFAQTLANGDVSSGSADWTYPFAPFLVV